MSGKHITNHQIRLFMQSKQHGKTIEVAAARAEFSERSAYRIQNPERNLKAKKRQWKTRQDPFAYPSTTAFSRLCRTNHNAYILT
jgi:hypothetical protein